MSYDQVTGAIMLGGVLLVAAVMACVDPKEVAPPEPKVDPHVMQLETRLGTLETRSVLIEGRLNHLRDCLMSKMTYAENLYQLRMGVLTCATASEKP